MVRTITLYAVAMLIAGPAQAAPPAPGWQKILPRPMTFHDQRTSVTLYVETDGRHIAAFDAHGDLLWIRCPFDDSHRNSNLTAIASLEEEDRGGNDPVVRITFTSSVFGAIYEKTGNFVLVGLD